MRASDRADDTAPHPAADANLPAADTAASTITSVTAASTTSSAAAAADQL